MGFSNQNDGISLLETGGWDDTAGPESCLGYKCFYIILWRNKHNIFEAKKAFPDVKRRRSAEETGMENTKAQRKIAWR